MPVVIELKHHQTACSRKGQHIQNSPLLFTWQRTDRYMMHTCLNVDGVHFPDTIFERHDFGQLQAVVAVSRSTIYHNISRSSNLPPGARGRVRGRKQQCTPRRASLEREMSKASSHVICSATSTVDTQNGGRRLLGADVVYDTSKPESVHDQAFWRACTFVCAPEYRKTKTKRRRGIARRSGAPCWAGDTGGERRHPIVNI